MTGARQILYCESNSSVLDKRVRRYFPLILSILLGCDEGHPSIHSSVDQGVDAQAVDSTAPDADRDDGVTDGGLFDGQAPDAGPSFQLVVEPALIATPVLIFEGPVQALAVAEQSLVVQSEDLIFEVGAGALRPESGQLQSAAWMADTLIVALDDGLWVRTADGFLRSPLSEAVPPVLDLAVYENALWLATTEGLYRWQDGVVQPIMPERLPMQSASLSVGLNGVWVEAEGAAYALKGEPLEALATGGVEPESAPVMDRSGAVWTVAQNQLWHLDDTAGWTPLDLPFTPQTVVASPLNADVWVGTAQGLWLLRGDRIRSLAGAPVGILAMDAEGAALVGTDQGLWRVPAGRRVGVEGLPTPPAALLQPQAIWVTPALPDHVISIEAAVDGIAVPVVDQTLMLSPADLSGGDHTLHLTVHWDDDVSAETTFRFISHLVSWEADIHGISQARCVLCHGENQNARLLANSAEWRTEIDAILNAVRTGGMPLGLPALSPHKIGLIAAWLATGMAEESP